MKIAIKTPPVKDPVSLDDIKLHLRIELDFTDEDTHLSNLIAAATGSVEQRLHRRLITQSWYQYCGSWPDNGIFTIPFGKLQSVASVKYKDQDGVEATWSSDEYIVTAGTEPGMIILGYNESYPTDTLYKSNPITIEFTCGYGDDPANIESAIQHAIKLMVSDMYETRETEVYGVSRTKLKTIDNLLNPYVLYNTCGAEL